MRSDLGIIKIWRRPLDRGQVHQWSYLSHLAIGSQETARCMQCPIQQFIWMEERTAMQLYIQYMSAVVQDWVEDSYARGVKQGRGE